MSKSHTQYISMRWNPSILDLITIFVRKFGGFESTYFTSTLFYMIGICKHERAATIWNIGFGVIIVEINWSCKGIASTNPKLLALTSSNFDSTLWFTFHSIFQKIIWPIWRCDLLNVYVCTPQYWCSIMIKHHISIFITWVIILLHGSQIVQTSQKSCEYFKQ
jgi:hypothetical protein